MLSLLLVTIFAFQALAHNFTIINGQIYTPGLAIVDAPQPFTPEGGDFLQVALDVSGDGRLALPPYTDNSSTQIFNITLFLFSYVTGKNFTISNGTAGSNDSSLGDIMLQEPGSTVKHVNWVWPDCLVGDGGSSVSDCKCENGTARGAYNISIHQSFRINGTNYYTIFDLPIFTTNSIPAESKRPSCAALNNPLLSQSALNSSVDTLSFQPWVNGSPSITGTNIPSTSSSSNSNSATSSSSSSSSSSNSSNSSKKDSHLLHWSFRTTVSWLLITAFFISL